MPRLGFKAEIGGRSALELARELVALARQGLKKRSRLDAMGRDESVHLAPLDEIVNSGRNSADLLLERYHTLWKGDIAPIFKEAAY